MKVRDVAVAMETIAPAGFAYSWDRIGLRIGSADQRVSRILTTLSVTRPVLDHAKRVKANLIVAHHSPIWDPIKTLDTNDSETALWLDIAKAGIACFGAHTNLDIAPGGVNDVLADRIGLENRSSLFPTPHVGLVKIVTFVPDTHVDAVRSAMAKAGAGTIGAYTECSYTIEGEGTFRPSDAANPFSGKRGKLNVEPEIRIELQAPEAQVGGIIAALRAAHPYEEVAYDVYPLRGGETGLGIGLIGDLPRAVSGANFAKHVRESLRIQHVRCVGNSRSVKRVGVLGGAGGSWVGNVPDGLDAYVTGDVGYHDAQLAEARGLFVVDAGHHGTEKWIAPALAARLRKALPKIPVTVHNERDPFKAIVAST